MLVLQAQGVHFEEQGFGAGVLKRECASEPSGGGWIPRLDFLIFVGLEWDPRNCISVVQVILMLQVWKPCFKNHCCRIYTRTLFSQHHKGGGSTKKEASLLHCLQNQMQTLHPNASII